MHNVKQGQIVAWFVSIALSAVLFGGIGYILKHKKIDHGDGENVAHAEGPKHGAEHHDEHAKAEGHDEHPKDNHAKSDISKATNDFETCEKESKQSPIDFMHAKVNDKEHAIKFDYAASDFEVVHTGHTIQANTKGHQSIEVDGEVYNLKEFHFHLPSEHKIDGIPGSMEAHFVHANEKGEMTVIGVMIEEKSENKIFKNLWEHLPNEASKTFALQKFDPMKALPSKHEYYSYKDSTKTASCSDGVRWLVLKEHIEMSGRQIDMFAAIIKNNARPIQPAKSDSHGVVSH